MSLPLPAIDRLFERLHVTYGRDFPSSFEGLDSGAVKSLWAHELSGFSGNLQAVAKALESLPERVPNVIQFRNICTRYLPDPGIGLPPPKANPEIIAMAMAALKPAEAVADKKAWARALKSRHDAGDRLNRNQIRCYKNALGLHADGVQL